MFSTRYYDADDYHRPYGRQRYYNYNQLRRHNEDSYDRYLRMKEQEDLEAAYARRRQRELQERQLYQHRRQQALAEREKKLREWKRQQQLLAYQQQQQQQQKKQQEEEHTEDNNDEDDNDYSIEIVRGRDGNFYYVKRQKPQHKVQPTITEEVSRQGQGFHSNHIVEEDSDYDDEVSSEESDVDSIGEDQAHDIVDEDVRTYSPRQLPRIPMGRKSRRKRRITVIVEDASDSECESEFDSPWRNRRPSPGQWMEPVEPYYA